ncbi:MAG: hypothetical protein LBC55_04560 [Desulfovibrio sp.]|jgi:BirA family biotin operon repressor/biotin-[acetyl-CoA-carboxylase] ligase|nr:hypothetical protein [Desulfovibrio sp.]
MHRDREEEGFSAALSAGLPSLARPMDGDDADALLGSRCLPRSDPAPDFFRNPAYAGCTLLWRERDGLDANGRAARIVASCAGGEKAGLPRGLDMPAACFLAGACSSAFHLAWQLSRDGLLPVWGSVLASCQESGYGQFRRGWHSPRGNLHVCFRLPADPQFRGDTAAVALGLLVCREFRKLGFPLSLKWPNDLLSEQRAKVGGMLVEERDGIIMAGLGVNTAEAPGAALLREEHAFPAAVLPRQDAAGKAGGAAVPFYLWRVLVGRLIVACGAGADGGIQTQP